MLPIAVLRALPLASLLLAACAPVASASVMERRGSELVFEDDPGQASSLTLSIHDGAVYPMYPSRPGGPGCDPGPQGLRCPLSGVTAIRVLLGVGDDDLSLEYTEAGIPPVAIDLGDGRNRLTSFSAADPGRIGSLDIRSGDGADRVDLFTGPGQLGDVTVASGGGDDLVALAVTDSATIGAGEGDDEIAVRSRGPAKVDGGGGGDSAVDVGGAPVTITGGGGDDTLGGQVGTTAELSVVDGGSGDDAFRTTAVKGAPLRLVGGPGTDLIESRDTNGAVVVCGAGRDFVWLSDADRPDTSCGPHLYGFDRVGGLRTCPGDPWRTRSCKAQKPRPTVVGRYGPSPRTLALSLGRVTVPAVIDVKITTVETRARPAVTLARRRLAVRKGAIRLTAPLTAAGRKMLASRRSMRLVMGYDLKRTGSRDSERAGYRVLVRRQE